MVKTERSCVPSVLYYKEDVDIMKLEEFSAFLDLRNLSKQLGWIREVVFLTRDTILIFEDRIVALANEFEEYKIIQSITGIGERLVATISSEIGEIDRLIIPKTLFAFAGIDRSVHSSGKFRQQ